MESLERSEAVIEIGKKIVSGLRLGEDVTAQWMAHLVAEKIAAAEAVGAKSSAVEECLDIILKLWEHYYGLPSYMRPMRELDPLLKTLSSLGIGEGANLRYIAHPPSDTELESASEEEKKLFELAVGVDNSARELIRYLISAAAERSVNAINPWLDDAAEADLAAPIERLLSEFVSKSLLTKKVNKSLHESGWCLRS
jgi:hypothetical protein